MPKFVSGDRVRDTHLGDSWWVVWDNCGLELYAKEQFLELV